MAAVPQERDSRLAERLAPGAGIALGSLRASIGGWLEDGLKAAFKAPSLPYQSTLRDLIYCVPAGMGRVYRKLANGNAEGIDPDGAFETPEQTAR